MPERTPEPEKHFTGMEPHMLAAFGDLAYSVCNIGESDVEMVASLGVMDTLAEQARDRFTMVHSTTPESAERILRDGYDLGYMPSGSIAGSFVHIVPDTYPDADIINETALAYRYKGRPTKIVFQFPFPTPSFDERNDKSQSLWGYTPLNDDDMVQGILEFDPKDPNRVRIPAKYIARVINLDDKTTTLPKPH